MLVAIFAAKLAGEPAPADEVRLAGLIAEPTAEDWRGLARLDGMLTRQGCESRMDRVFDPWGGLRDYLRLGRDRVAIYASARDRREPLVVIRFAQRSRGVRAPPGAYRNPGATDPPVATDRPLAGLRVVIEPADIGGVWAAMEDRSVDFPGYGQTSPPNGSGLRADYGCLATHVHPARCLGGCSASGNVLKQERRGKRSQ